MRPAFQAIVEARLSPKFAGTVAARVFRPIDKAITDAAFDGGIGMNKAKANWWKKGKQSQRILRKFQGRGQGTEYVNTIDNIEKTYGNKR